MAYINLLWRLKNSQKANYDLTPMPDQISELFLAASVKRMQLSEDDINRCLDKLSDAQMRCRGGDHENSIANLLLHLEGNLRQWFLHGIDGQPDVRVRDEEFTLSPSQPCEEIRRRFAATLAECRSVIGSLPPERMLEPPWHPDLAVICEDAGIRPPCWRCQVILRRG